MRSAEIGDSVWLCFLGVSHETFTPKKFVPLGSVGCKRGRQKRQDISTFSARRAHQKNDFSGWMASNG
ncbi:hypothetical protein [uncultured Desulfovibrio sp.]|uniref:hypothetical protein n=1 Tax=uncultured Desulfovibrio sp. TaxID=167968 RepID=UPI00260186BD|nr:hypothetical protein [uncultured Desulfovibrio sp.]